MPPLHNIIDEHEEKKTKYVYAGKVMKTEFGHLFFVKNAREYVLQFTIHLI